MRILVINTDRTVTEIDAELDDLTEEELDAFSLGDHDVWVIEGAIFGDAPIATVAGNPIALPAYVTGRSGEGEGDATMAVEEIEKLIG